MSAGERPPPSVVIVDDHALFRAGVRSELEGLVEVRAEAGTVSEAVAAIARAESPTWSCSTSTCRTAAGPR